MWGLWWVLYLDKKISTTSETAEHAYILCHVFWTTPLPLICPLAGRWFTTLPLEGNLQNKSITQHISPSSSTHYNSHFIASSHHLQAKSIYMSLQSLGATTFLCLSLSGLKTAVSSTHMMKVADKRCGNATTNNSPLLLTSKMWTTTGTLAQHPQGAFLVPLALVFLATFNIQRERQKSNNNHC